ncbi:hypothetical protein Mgra_00004986 [Meloidogyne graminicola]|uniref:Uncharacterized protein n=1 Tax=Meloidogyne graminicola TaxID=189291 RepID=A0A8S9ZRB3_9BILA|nr:hypothetical protein Mgra_00004986 [Meloidogyne graminicola]
MSKSSKNNVITKKISTDLLLEITNFLPFNLKWANLRISSNFDILLLKNQRKCIFRLKHILRLRAEIVAAIRRITNNMTTLNDFPDSDKKILWFMVPMVWGVALTVAEKFVTLSVVRVTNEWSAVDTNPAPEEFSAVFSKRTEILLKLLEFLRNLGDEELGTLGDDCLRYSQKMLHRALNPEMYDISLPLRFTMIRGERFD